MFNISNKIQHFQKALVYLFGISTSQKFNYRRYYYVFRASIVLSIGHNMGTFDLGTRIEQCSHASQECV